MPTHRHSLGLYFVLWRYSKPSVYGQGGLTLSFSLPPTLSLPLLSLPLSIFLSLVIVVAWMSTPARRFARQGRKDDKTTLERVRDTNRGINGGVKEVREGTGNLAYNVRLSCVRLNSVDLIGQPRAVLTRF